MKKSLSTRWGQGICRRGAKKEDLGFSPLHEAVALGSLAEVRDCVAQGADVEVRDGWSRTPFLLAVLVGDREKVAFLLEQGADRDALGRCGYPAIFYAIAGHHPEMLRLLLQSGADAEARDEFGTTALIMAVEHEDAECVKILLDAGVDVDVDVDSNGTALGRAQARDVIGLLLQAGADPGELSFEGKRSLLGLSEIRADELGSVSPDEYREGRDRVFGRQSPERMRVPFWEAMIRAGTSAYEARARFNEASALGTEPVWCAQRYGQSLTFLPDGRAIQIGGEHEDYYDVDFCIYNDVFVHEPDGSFAIYGYPESVFPPTDFHTATLVGEHIYVIGSAGYVEQREIGRTAVFRLHVPSLRMERLATRGDDPSNIYRHRAVALGSHEIRVWGGKIISKSEGKEVVTDNDASFVLDVVSLEWRRAPGS